MIEDLKLKNDNKFLEFCPEVIWKNKPKDREYFFNIVNTLFPHKIEKMVYESVI